MMSRSCGTGEAAAGAGAAPDAATLAAFLLGRGEPPPPEYLRARGVAAYAYAVLPDGHPVRPALRADYLASLARHHALKREAVPLLAAWRSAGIEALLFKGFHLAEFVYPAPGMRFHGDVDVLIPHGREAEAAGVAREAGWAVELESDRVVGRPYIHGAFNAVRVGGAAQVDAHRWILHSPVPWNGAQRRITAGVWARSVEREWEGVRIREPDPVDALLVALVLQRCWGADRWGLKPCDVLDFRYLAERRGVTSDALWARAREIGCTRTLARFLERCDPDAGRFDLRRPRGAALWRLDRSALPERGPLGLERPAARLLHSPGVAVDLARALPGTIAAVLRLRRERDIRRLLASLEPAAPPAERSSERRRFRTVRAIRWAARLLPTLGSGSCLVRSVALYAALRRQGWPVVFASGVRREPDGVHGHAWVELDGRILPELNEPGNPGLYRVVLRHPSPGEPGAERPPWTGADGPAPSGTRRRR